MSWPGGQQPGAPEATPRCYRHPNREALIRCTRCDRPICPDCMRPASVGFHCPDDVDGAAKTVRQPRTTVGALIRQSPPYVTSVLVATNIVIYLITVTQHGAKINDPTSSSVLHKLWLAPTAIHDNHEYYRLLSSAFVHLSLLHIASNMLALAFTGPALEMVLGRWRFASVYFLSALGGGAAVYAFGNEVNFTAGASGAIFGLFGAALVLAKRVGLDLQSLIGVIVLNFVLTFSINGISKLGHLGGFVTGILAGLVIGGWPTMRTRVPTRIQVGGLAGLLVLVCAVVGIGTATW